MVTEAESAALRGWLAARQVRVSSAVLVAELHRAVGRQAPVSAAAVEAFLRRIDLLPVDEALLRRAGALEPPSLRTLDAIHLASALALELDDVAVVTYDQRMRDAAEALGLSVAAPA